MLSLLDLVRELTELPHRADQRVAAALERLLDALGPLRDAQNDRHRVKHARGGDGIEPLKRHLKRREARRMRRARHAVAHARSTGVVKAGARLRAALVMRSRETAPAERVLRLVKAVDVAAADVRNRLAGLDVASPRSVHRLRIALRRFRYAVELAKRLSPAFDVTGQATVLALQRRLGRAHDAEMLLDRIDRFTRRHRRATGSGLDALRQTIDAERKRQLNGLTRALIPLRQALTTLADRAASPAAVRTD